MRRSEVVESAISRKYRPSVREDFLDERSSLNCARRLLKASRDRTEGYSYQRARWIHSEKRELTTIYRGEKPQEKRPPIDKEVCQKGVVQRWKTAELL